MYNVLLVDDEPMVTDGMTKFFNWEESGFHVVSSVSSVARALMFLENNKVDLVITDINMPIQNGIDLIRILKDEYPDIKTIILSGYSEFSYAQSAIRLGALDYLTKPINFSNLKAVLKDTKELLDKINENDSLSNLLKSTLLMNFINGYPYDDKKASAILNPNKPIYIAKAIVEDESDINTLIAKIQLQYKGSTILTAEENTILIIFEDIEEENELRLNLSTLCKEKPNAIVGLSERGGDYSALRKLALQAMKAMKYQYVTGKAGVMSYSQVKNQYIDIEKRHESIIKEMIEILSTSTKRDSITNYYLTTLISLNGSLAYQKRFSTEVLVEINLAMKNYNIDEVLSKGSLSTTLIEAVNANTLEELTAAVTKYLNRIKEVLNKRDESVLDGELSERVKAYINIHYAEDLSLNNLADFFYISPVYLSRVFKKKTGTNYIDYLTNVRIEKAKEYLQDKNIKVYTIPPLVGYDNPRYFNKLFKEVAGMTPGEYRESFIG